MLPHFRGFQLEGVDRKSYFREFQVHRKQGVPIGGKSYFRGFQLEESLISGGSN